MEDKTNVIKIQRYQYTLSPGKDCRPPHNSLPSDSISNYFLYMIYSHTLTLSLHPPIHHPFSDEGKSEGR